MENYSFLEHLGLDEHEIEVYIALIKNSPQSIADIKRATNLHRPTIYEAIDTLLDKNIVTTTPKGKRTLYTAEPPSRLREQKQKIDVDIQSGIDELKRLHEISKNEINVRFYQGKENVKKIYLDLVDHLEKGDIYFRYTSRSEDTEGEDYLPTNYRKLRDKKSLERFIIASPWNREKKQKKKRLERAVKAIPREDDSFEYDVTEIIYGERTAFIDYNTESAIIIESKPVADFQRHVFKALYKRLD